MCLDWGGVCLLRGGAWSGGVSAPGEGVSAPGGCLVQGVCSQGGAWSGGVSAPGGMSALGGGYPSMH